MQSQTFSRTFAVEENWQDFNGHMNVTGYLFYFNRAMVAIFEDIGFGTAGIAAHGGSWFAGQQQITYLREVLVGDEITISVRFLDVAEKKMRFVAVMQRGDETVATMESLSIYVNATTRRADTIPPHLREVLLRAMQYQTHIAVPDTVGLPVGSRRKTAD